MERSEYQNQNILSDQHMMELVEFTFELNEKLKDADAAIDALLSKIGEMFKLDSIVVKEVVEDGLAIRCTYEWSSDGHKNVLNLERRFLDDLLSEWENRYRLSPDGVYFYRCEDAAEQTDAVLPVHLCQNDRVRCLLQVPLYKGGKFVGCVDFSDYMPGREWQGENIAGLINACRIMSTYMFGMRKAGTIKEHLKELITTDSTTKLPTYEIFLSNIEESVNAQDGMAMAIISADVVNFKYLNEKFGYEIGDRVLRVFAETVYEAFNRTVGCCREYSDNFVIAIKFPNDVSEDAVRFRVDRMVYSYRQKLEEQGIMANVCINSGIFLMHEGYTDIRTALTNANFARKNSRKMTGTGISRSSVFHDDMVEARKKDQDLVSRVQQAIEEKEFRVFLQPKVTCDGMRIVGAEALVRWQCPDGSFMSPDAFIPAFEKDGCIEKVDYFVYKQVFRYLRERLDRGLPCVTVSMNVSRYHLFSIHFISYIEELQKDYNIPPQYLEFELTESVYIGDFPAVTYTIKRLKMLGIKVSLDDFGSEYSSLDILTKLPIDMIKLDKVFMKKTLSETDKILISCIIEMAKGLNLTVLCEGVEYDDQRSFLCEAGCDQFQGFLFSKPVDMEAFNRLLEGQVRKQNDLIDKCGVNISDSTVRKTD